MRKTPWKHFSIIVFLDKKAFFIYEEIGLGLFLDYSSITFLKNPQSI